MNNMEEKIMRKIDADLFFFYYQGSFLSKPGVNILHVLEKNIEPVLTKKTVKRAFFFGIEMIQNIEKYSANSPDIIDSIALIKDKKGMQLISENAVHNSDVEKLKNHMDKISNSSKKELEKWYFQRLTETINDGSRSPGIGLIELNRRGNNQLSYQFKKVNDQYSIFKLQICMYEKEQHLLDSSLYNLIKDYYHNYKTAIIYSGLFNNKLLLPLVELIDELELVENKTIVSKYQHCTIEMIQNANEHGIYKDGVGGFFTLLQKEEAISVACCNMVNESTKLIDSIEDLNSKTDEELRVLNYEKLLNLDTNGGIGFNQLAQYSRPSPLKTKSFSIDGLNDFFYIECLFKLDDD